MVVRFGKRLLAVVLAAIVLTGCTSIEVERSYSQTTPTPDGPSVTRMTVRKKVEIPPDAAEILHDLVEAGVLVALPHEAVVEGAKLILGDKTYGLGNGTVTDPNVKAKWEALQRITEAAFKDDLWDLRVPADGLQALQNARPGDPLVVQVTVALSTPQGTTHVDLPIMSALYFTPLGGAPVIGGLGGKGFQPGVAYGGTIPVDIPPLLPGLGAEDLLGHWAARPVWELMNAGILGPQWLPDAAVDRASLAVWLVRALGLPRVRPLQASFIDVATAPPYFVEIESAAAARILRGMGDGSFAAVADLTREQAATALVRALGKEGAALALSPAAVDQALGAFTDARNIAAWARPYVAYAAFQSLVTGYPDHSFQPQRALTRAEAAVLVAKALPARP